MNWNLLDGACVVFGAYLGLQVLLIAWQLLISLQDLILRFLKTALGSYRDMLLFAARLWLVLFAVVILLAGSYAAIDRSQAWNEPFVVFLSRQAKESYVGSVVYPWFPLEYLASLARRVASSMIQ